MRIGITGINGFIGFHLSNSLRFTKNINPIKFNRDFFDNNEKLDKFTLSSDVIIHLAGVNRAENEAEILDTNTALANKLSDSLIRTKFKGKIIYISSIQEDTDSVYGKSKLLARKTLASASLQHGFKSTALIVPNVFGPFCKPNYNSFIATFSNLLTQGEEPIIIDDEKIKLLYIDNLVNLIIKAINDTPKEKVYIQHDIEIKVSEVLKKLREFQQLYLNNGEIPDLNDKFDLALFNTFRSYINYKKEFPIKYKNNKDSRGNFIEVLRSNSEGQYSYSLTKPGITRGNHFHKRKIERFAVISGEALIQLRKIGSEEIIDYKLSGNNPSFIDMPIWYTHSIKNIGDSDLITLFWINEPYNEKDPDTFFEKV